MAVQVDEIKTNDIYSNTNIYFVSVITNGSNYVTPSEVISAIQNFLSENTSMSINSYSLLYVSNLNESITETSSDETMIDSENPVLPSAVNDLYFHGESDNYYRIFSFNRTIGHNDIVNDSYSGLMSIELYQNLLKLNQYSNLESNENFFNELDERITILETIMKRITGIYSSSESIELSEYVSITDPKDDDYDEDYDDETNLFTYERFVTMQNDLEDLNDKFDSIDDTVNDAVQKKINNIETSMMNHVHDSDDIISISDFTN